MSIKKIVAPIFLSVFIAVLLVGSAIANGSFTILDSFNSEGIPQLEGELTTDGNNLFLEVKADPMAVSGNNAYMAWLVYTGDAEPEGFAGPWDDTYLLLDNWFNAGPQGNIKWGVGSGSTHPWSNQGVLPAGVDLVYAEDGNIGVWTMTIPYSVIGVELGDTISYMVQARYQDSQNLFEGVSLSLNQSHGNEGFNPLWFSANFQTVTLELAPGEPEDKDACKNGGWESYGFKNQGACVSYLMSNENAGKRE